MRLSTVMQNQLEPYQEKFVENILKSLEKDTSVLAQLSTGGGKTVVFASIVRQNKPKLVELRKKYESDGTIVNYTFRKAVKFNSISGASTFILGSSANGGGWEKVE